MSACFKTKAQAITGFCDEFPGFCTVEGSVPSDVEKRILLDNDADNDMNDCDGGFDFDLACPTACGKSQTTIDANYRVVADAFGGGKECPYYDGFEISRTCPATPDCEVDCEGSWSAWSGNYTCPSTCGYGGGTLTQSRTWTTSAAPTGQKFVNCPTTETQQKKCPATPACKVDCDGSWESPTCPTECGTPASKPSQTWKMVTDAENGGSCPNTGTAPTYECPATPDCEVPCEGSWSAWSGNYTCPSTCGYGGGTLTQSRTWTTSAAPTGQKFVNCPTTETQQKKCSATPPCPVDCVGSWKSPPCPTACGTPASTPIQTWEMITYAKHGGSCPNTGPAPTTPPCPATPDCEVPCQGSWSDWTNPCPTGCGDSVATVSQIATWITSPAPTGQKFVNCPTRKSQQKDCPAIPKCQDTPFVLPQSKWSELGLERLPDTWPMIDGYMELSSWFGEPFVYSFTSPELLYLRTIKYTVHEKSDVIPTAVEWYKINPDDTLSRLPGFFITNYTSSNENWARFVAGKGVRYPNGVCKGVVLKITQKIQNPNYSAGDWDFRLIFDIKGVYAGKLA